MRKLILFCLSLSLFTCDDGDIITVELDFEDTFSQCGDLVFYKTKDVPSESLSLQLSTTIQTLIDNFTNGMAETTMTLNGTTDVFNYRTYDANLPIDYFCNDVPPSGVSILSDEQSNEGTALITLELIEDDDDGVPAALEDINGNGNLTDDDTDGDLIPNYLDDDDDGDNVLTSAENPDGNNDGNLDDALDTDGDTIPNYLDDDDDGDGVLTRDEETDTPDQDPTNDIDNPSIGPDYLNDMFSMSVPATAYREHRIDVRYQVKCIVNDISLPTFTQQTFNFGTLTKTDPDVNTERFVTPDFN